MIFMNFDHIFYFKFEEKKHEVQMFCFSFHSPSFEFVLLLEICYGA